MSFKLLFTIIFVSLLMSAGLLYYRLAFKDPVVSTEVTTSSSGVSSAGLLETDGSGQVTPATIAIAEYSRLLGVISAIDKIDNAIFFKPTFISLVEFSFPIPTPLPYRNNPFAPVGAP